MPVLHSIRLRGPWQWEAIACYSGGSANHATSDAADLPPPGRITMPGDWSAVLGSDFRGRVRFTRRFNRPTGLEPGNEVWIALDAVRGSAQAWLNDTQLGPIDTAQGPALLSVNACLREHNELVVEIDQPAEASEPGGIVGEVRLEIHA